MTIPNSWILCYVREKEELRQQEKVHQFFQMLASHNCALASTLEIASTVVWKRYVSQTPIESDDKGEVPFASALQPGASEHVQHELRVYVAELQEQLTVEARLMARSQLLRGFEFTVTLAPDDGAILLSVDHERFFRPGQAGVMKFRYWVKLLQEVYAFWHPLFMHEFSHFGSTNPGWEEVRSLTIPALYPLNIFSPPLVHKLGQEKLAQAPAWMIETLEDQAVLLIPTDTYGLTPDKTYDFTEVAHYLGFSTEDPMPSNP